MATKVKKVTKPSAKTLLSTEIAYWKGKSKAAEEQNEALSDQVSGLQSEVADLDQENDSLAAEAEELEERNDALQSSLVDQLGIITALEDEVEDQENLLKLADVIIFTAGEFEKTASAKLAELEQENFHLSIQLAAAKDKFTELESDYKALRKRPVIISRIEF